MAALVTLTLAAGSGAPGSLVTLNLSIASTGGALPADVQWVFTLTSDVTLVSMALGASGISATKILSRSGTTCIVYGLNTNVIPDGVLATVTLQIAASPSTNSISLGFSSSAASDASAGSIPTATVGSTLTVLSPTLSCPIGGGTAIVGLAYYAQMVGSGGTLPYTISGSGFPSGLSMSTSGLITGTPTAAGSSTYSATLTDALGATAPCSCTIVVAAPAPPPMTCTVIPVPGYTPPLLLLNEPVEQVGT